MSPIHTPQDHRNAWLTVNLLLLASALFFLTSLSGCMTYERAVKKFGHMAYDSTTITVRDTVIIPKDSVSLILKNDTTTVYREIQQGRAKVIVERTHTYTIIKATCAGDTIARETKAKVAPRVSFGVAGWYQPAFWIVSAILGMIAMIVAFFAPSVYNNLRRSHADD